jgi:hypothetical protein
MHYFCIVVTLFKIINFNIDYIGIIVFIKIDNFFLNFELELRKHEPRKYVLVVPFICVFTYCYVLAVSDNATRRYIYSSQVYIGLNAYDSLDRNRLWGDLESHNISRSAVNEMKHRCNNPTIHYKFQREL